MYMQQQLRHVPLFACEHTVLGCVSCSLWDGMCSACVNVHSCISWHVIIIWIIRRHIKGNCFSPPAPSVKQAKLISHYGGNIVKFPARCECITHMNMRLLVCLCHCFVIPTVQDKHHDTNKGQRGSEQCNGWKSREQTDWMGERQVVEAPSVHSELALPKVVLILHSHFPPSCKICTELYIVSRCVSPVEPQYHQLCLNWGRRWRRWQHRYLHLCSQRWNGLHHILHRSPCFLHFQTSDLVHI